MKLYYCKTTNPRKVCALAKHLALDVDYEYVDLFARAQHQPKFAAINPNNKVPVLVDGQTTVIESTAIMMYLARAADSALWPENFKQQVEIVQWLSWDSAHLSRHASTVYFEHIIKPMAFNGEPDPETVREAVGFFTSFARILDEHLAERPFLVAEDLTIADFGTACVMTVAQEQALSELPLGDFPHICRWLARLSELPAWRDPWPAD